MFPAGATVIVAVSGGPDSTCLLHALVRARRLLRIRGLVACHVDHRLRPDSRLDAVYVRRQADRLDVEFVLRSLTSPPTKGESVEAWARQGRYAALAEVRQERGAAAVATGHTADDQAETVLMALVRGGGLEALGGIRPLADGVARPLLGVTAEQTRAFCAALHLRPRTDPMNDDPSFLRVAIRTQGLPALRAATGRDVRPTLARTAALLQADGDLLAAMAATAAGAVVDAGDGHAIRMRADALRALPRPIASRVARRALLDAGVVPTAALVDSTLDLAAGRGGRRVQLPGGLVGRREREYVSLSPSPG
jgi:tRNA(Ile)-lysidine synthase